LAGKLSGEEGFGLIELLIAMLVLALGIMAIVAGFSSGLIALDRASRAGTAGTLADKQMEGYRALGFSGILLTNAPSPGLDTTHTTDPAYDSVNAVATGTCTGAPQCAPIQTVTGPDGDSYRVDTFIVWSCPVGTLQLSGSLPSVTYPACTDSPPTMLLSKAVKKITVVVREGTDTTKTYIRVTSTFDEWT
jgi:prepilin-type N-terminal cleavage/methylation domain-containing protein